MEKGTMHYLAIHDYTMNIQKLSWTFVLGLHLQYMETTRLRSIWKYSCQTTPQPQQHQIWAASVTYTTAYGNARSLTHWARPGIEPASSWFLVRFVNPCAMTGTPWGAHLIPSPAQWVQDPTLPQLRRKSYLPLGSDPSPGAPYAAGWPKKEKR